MDDSERPKPERTPVEVLEANVTAPTTELIDRSLIRGGALSAFGYRDFSLLWSGAFLSNVGTLIHTTALLWYINQLTSSSAWVGAVNFANFLPIILFVLYAGSLADRLDRRKLILWTQALMMLVALLLGLAVSLGWIPPSTATSATTGQLLLIVAITVFMGVAFVFNFPAWRAMVPDLVPHDLLLNAVALDAAGYNMARFIGPALGALILNVWNVAGAFYINAISFLAVIAALLLIRYRPPESAPPEESAWTQMREGARYMWRNSWTRNLIFVLGISAFFGLSYIVLLPSVARDVLHGGSWAYGFLLGAVGLGAAVGAPIVTLLNRRLKERELIKYGLLIFSLMVLVLAASRAYWLSLAATFGMGLSFLTASASINTVLQARADRLMRGRVMSFYILLFQGTAPVGGLLFGYVADVRSTPFALLIGGLVVLALALVLIFVPSILKDAVSSAMPPAAADGVTR